MAARPAEMALRADTVLVRAVGVPLRDTVVPVRALVVVAVRALTVVGDGVVVADWRLTLDASRTAALATPMPTAIVPTKSNNFFILVIYIISKR